MLRPIALALGLAVASNPIASARADTAPPQETKASSKKALLVKLAALEKRQTVASQISKTLLALSKESMPDGLTEAEKKVWPKFIAHVESCADRIQALHDALAPKLADLKQKLASVSDQDSQALLAATKQMQETQMSFNLQYLQLQSQMQNENRSYTAVSNIMKTKHDTVKNSISNVR